MNLETYSDNFQKTINKEPGFIQALILIAIAGAISIVIGPLVQWTGTLFPLIQKWSLFISYSLSFGLLLVFAQKWWRVAKFETTTVNIIVYLLLVPVILAMSVIMEGLVNLIPMPEKIQQMFEQMVQLNLQGYLTLGIAAPILEELIFRGVILKKFLEKYSPAKAIIFSAIIFGLAHMNPWQFIAAFFIGLAIGYIYWKTKSIWPGIFMHFANNSFSFYLAKKYESVNVTFQDLIGNTTYYISLIIICLLVCYSIYLVLDHYFKKLHPET